MPGACAVSEANWIHVIPLLDRNIVAAAGLRLRLGAGETSAIFLARQLGIDLVLMDEWRGRRFAREAGLSVLGCIGILEELHKLGLLVDLRRSYLDLIRQNIRIDSRTLAASLASFNLPPL